MSNGTIPLKHIGDMHILTSDLVNVFKNADVLRTLSDNQLVTLQSSVGGEFDRRKKLASR
jgi:hypothetical protein